MEKWSTGNRLLRFIYQHLIVRFTKQIREPYLIQIDNIDPDPHTNELLVSFHIANKRVNQDMPVAEFIKTDMVYMVDPLVMFYMGQQYGSHTERHTITKKKELSFKNKCAATIKRVFIDE